MSDEIKPESVTQTDPTTQAAVDDRKVREARINARIEDLKSYEGKWFARNDGSGHPIQVLKYAGIAVKDGQAEYTFLAETLYARWTPPATKFLEEHHVIAAPATATINSEPK
jgi:hypothetical protein